MNNFGLNGRAHKKTFAQNMKNCLAIFICTFAILFGCALSFNSKYSELKVGTSKDTVMTTLGEPDFRKEAVMLDGLFWGPQASLSSILKPCAIYHEWRYEKGGQIYYIWFSDNQVVPKDKWKVTAKSTHPKGAVFEPTH